MPNYRKNHVLFPDLALHLPADPAKVLARFRFGTYEFLGYEAAYYNFMCSLHAFNSTGCESFVTAADFGLVGSTSLGNSPLCERILNSLRSGILPDAKDYLVFTMCTTDGQVSPTMQPADFDTVGVVQELASLVSSFIATSSPPILEFFISFSARSRWSFNDQFHLQFDFNPPPLDLKKFVPSSACIEDTRSKQFVSLGNHWTSVLHVFSYLPFIPRLSQAIDVPHIAEYTSYHVYSTITLEYLMRVQGIRKVLNPDRNRKYKAQSTPEPVAEPVVESFESFESFDELLVEPVLESVESFDELPAEPIHESFESFDELVTDPIHGIFESFDELVAEPSSEATNDLFDEFMAQFITS